VNIIDIILLAILAISFISGMQKGFLASLLAAFGFVGAWVVASALNMTLSQQFMSSQLHTWLEANVSFDGILEKIGNIGGEYCASVMNSVNNIARSLTESGVPQGIANAFENNIALFQTATVSEYLNQTVWQGAFNVISFAIIFAISYAVLMLVVNLLNNIFRMPKLRGVDWLLGGAFGLVRGYVVVCLVASILPLLFTALDAEIIDTFLKESSVAEFFLKGDSVFADLFGVEGQLEKIIMELPKLN